MELFLTGKMSAIDVSPFTGQIAVGSDDGTLTVLDELPEGLLEISAKELHQYLSGPTLIRLQGESTNVLFVSVLLHGNETTGWDAIRELLIENKDKTLSGRLKYTTVRLNKVARWKKDLSSSLIQP